MPASIRLYGLPVGVLDVARDGDLSFRYEPGWLERTQLRERLHGIVDLTGVPEPQLHAKFLAWDTDHVVVSSLNWGSQSGLEDNPLDEIGLYLEGPSLATSLLDNFERELE